MRPDARFAKMVSTYTAAVQELTVWPPVLQDSMPRPLSQKFTITVMLVFVCLAHLHAGLAPAREQPALHAKVVILCQELLVQLAVMLAGILSYKLDLVHSVIPLKLLYASLVLPFVLLALVGPLAPVAIPT